MLQLTIHLPSRQGLKCYHAVMDAMSSWNYNDEADAMELHRTAEFDRQARLQVPQKSPVNSKRALSTAKEPRKGALLIGKEPCKRVQLTAKEPHESALLLTARAICRSPTTGWSATRPTSTTVRR